MTVSDFAEDNELPQLHKILNFEDNWIKLQGSSTTLLF